jgi:hypothetical protein
MHSRRVEWIAVGVALTLLSLQVLLHFFRHLPPMR